MTTHTQRETFGKGYISFRFSSNTLTAINRHKGTKRHFAHNAFENKRPWENNFRSMTLFSILNTSKHAWKFYTMYSTFWLNPHNPNVKAPIHWHKNMFSSNHTGYRLAFLTIEKNGMKYFKLRFESSLSDKLNCCYYNNNKNFILKHFI